MATRSVPEAVPAAPEPPPVVSGTKLPAPGWVRRLWGYMMMHRRDLTLAVGAAVLGSVCLTLIPLVERQIVDGVVVSRSSSLWPWLVLLVALALASFGLLYLRRYRGGRVALSVQYDLRNAMHTHLQVMDFDNLDRMPTGQLVARANSDSTLVQGLLSFFPIMSGNILLMLFSLGVMIYLSPLLSIVSVIIAPTLLLVSYRMRRKVFPATWDGQQREGDVIQIVDEDVNGVRIVKAFGQEQRELQRVTDASQVLYGSQMRAVRLQARYQPLLEAIPTIGQVVILAFGGWLALHHEISLGTFLAFSTYIVQLVSPARQLAGVLTIGQQARAGIERIFQLLDLRPAIGDAPDAIALPVLKGSITFADVHFSYGSGSPVLDGFNLQIGAGERVAIVGPSGSGKSTVAMLVPRFYDPAQGCVLVDGHDLQGVTLHSLRRQIGVVFEESFLFSDTVRFNVAYGRPDATDEEIESAAQVAQAHEFIRELPRGYDTVVGERGLTLSGGQRQRIALARAILSDPRILILDDATSAIDSKVEERIYDGLRSVLADRTTLLIAHRQSTLRLADRIVVILDGRVAEQGTHEELMERSSVYRTLLSGIEEDPLQQAGDRIEELSALTSVPEQAGATSSAWVAADVTGGGARSAVRTVGAPSIGPGLGGGGGGGGGGGWRLNLAPTSELLARVAALPPVRDTARIDMAKESAHLRNFSLARLLNAFRRPLLFALVLVIIDALASLAGPVLIKTGIDNGVAKGSIGVLFVAAAIFLFITLIDLIDQVGETFVTGGAAERIMLSLRIRIWAQLQRLSVDYYEREMAGRIMTRMTTDVDQFESLIENGVLSALVSAVTFVGVGCALVVINLELGLCTLSVVVPLAVATVIFRRKAARLYDLSRERIAIVNADFQESLSGVRVSQAFVHRDETVAHFQRLGRDYLESRVAAQRLVALYFPFVQFLSGVADAIVLGAGAGLIASGHLTSGALIAFILYIDLFFSPIQQLSQVFDSWQQTRVSVRRIADLMQLEPLTVNPADPVVPSRLRGEITLDNVRFAYPSFSPIPTLDGRSRGERRGPKDPRLPVLADAEIFRAPEALRGISLRIEAGETVALVGQTGAGKSTLMKLLARFYDPDQGAVRVDGHDLRTLDLLGYRHQLGYVPQEAFLFTGTVRDNIAYGRPEASNGEVELAARAVGAHDFIAALPGGYLHELAERGRSLSSGQRQLLALARAELVDPVILLLDEATSNLDLVTETHVAEAMQKVSRNRTTVIIAHRLQTARAANRVIVLHQGQVVEVGSHDALRALGGRYASMWDAFELSVQSTGSA
jgi:ATP-binding cassette, subfamily B, bacterial